MSQQAQQREIKVNFPQHLVGGVYCNLMRVSHTKEEFIMDHGHGELGPHEHGIALLLAKKVY